MAAYMGKACKTDSFTNFSEKPIVFVFCIFNLICILETARATNANSNNNNNNTNKSWFSESDCFQGVVTNGGRRYFTDADIKRFCQHRKRWQKQALHGLAKFHSRDSTPNLPPKAKRWVENLLKCDSLLCLCLNKGQSARKDYCNSADVSSRLNMSSSASFHMTSLPETNAIGGNEIVKNINDSALLLRNIIRAKRNVDYEINDLLFAKVTRKEIRRLTMDERRLFFRVVNQLKEVNLDGVSKYDALVSYHKPENAPTAHFCPSFLPFHREYTRTFELAMQEIKPLISVPYWDTTLDARLPNPKDSIVWSADFFGSGTGEILDGPFARWTPVDDPKAHQYFRSFKHVARNTGLHPVGRMLNSSLIHEIMSRTTFKQLTFCHDIFFEMIHNFQHAWIGGHMLDFRTAPNDPLFFAFHAFIDYVWEQWRDKRQTRQERESDYASGHCGVYCSKSGTMRLKPFWKTEIEALSNHYTDHLYDYEMSPGCSRAKPHCDSDYLFCDRKHYRCVSKVKLGGMCTGFEETDICYNGVCIAGRCMQLLEEPTEPPKTRTEKIETDSQTFTSTPNSSISSSSSLSSSSASEESVTSQINLETSSPNDDKEFTSVPMDSSTIGQDIPYENSTFSVSSTTMESTSLFISSGVTVDSKTNLSTSIIFSTTTIEENVPSLFTTTIISEEKERITPLKTTIEEDSIVITTAKTNEKSLNLFENVATIDDEKMTNTLWTPVTVLRSVHGGQHAAEKYTSAIVVTTDRVNMIRLTGRLVKENDELKLKNNNNTSDQSTNESDQWSTSRDRYYAQLPDPFILGKPVEAIIDVLDEKGAKCLGFCLTPTRKNGTSLVDNGQQQHQQQRQTGSYEICDVKIELSLNPNMTTEEYLPPLAASLDQAKFLNWNGTDYTPDKYLFLCNATNKKTGFIENPLDLSLKDPSPPKNEPATAEMNHQDVVVNENFSTEANNSSTEHMILNNSVLLQPIRNESWEFDSSELRDLENKDEHPSSPVTFKVHIHTTTARNTLTDHTTIISTTDLISVPNNESPLSSTAISSTNSQFETTVNKGGQSTSFVKPMLNHVHPDARKLRLPSSLNFLSSRPLQNTVLECIDFNGLCKFWASEGECVKNPVWMLPNCRHSCGQCRMLRNFH